MWLGIPVCKDNVRCRFCHVNMDKYGAHATTCKYGTNIVRRHNRIRNYLYRKMREAGYVCQLEKKKLDAADGKKPADIYVESLLDNEPTAVDISVTSSVQKVIINKKNKKVYDAADHQVKIKMKKYEDFIARNEIKYVPFVCETFGGLSAAARKILRRLAHDLKDKVRRSFSVIMDRLQKCVCIRIWKSCIEALQERTFWECSEQYEEEIERTI